MPNLIEQQDLLKGITDERLSGLLQNPIGDIPPFLVAAEAQRRQAIRQQFSGQDQQESVVDSLAKQLSNVPQNIQSSAPQQGIAGIPQQPPQQGMRHGGQVQRYAEKGLVEESYFPSFSDFFPSFSSPSLTAEEIANMPRDQYLALEEERKYAPGVGGAKATYLHRNPVVPKTELQAAEEEAYAATHGIPSIFYGPEARYEAAQGVVNKQNEIENAYRPVTEPRDLGMYGDKTPTYSTQKPVDPKTANPKAPREPNSSVDDTSYENKMKAQDAAIRKRIEELYKSEDKGLLGDPAKWFAMSQAFLQPDTSTLESFVNAGAAFAGGTAEEKRQQREDLRAREEALLKYDIGLNEREAEQHAAEVAARIKRAEIADQRAYEKQKSEYARTHMSSDQVANIYSTVVKQYEAKIEASQKIINDPLAPEADKAMAKAEIEALVRKRDEAQGVLSNLVASSYGPMNADVIHIPQ